MKEGRINAREEEETVEIAIDDKIVLNTQNNFLLIRKAKK